MCKDETADSGIFIFPIPVQDPHFDSQDLFSDGDMGRDFLNRERVIVLEGI
jgi:hypothetical protein